MVGSYVPAGFLVHAKEKVLPRTVQQDYVDAVVAHASEIYIDASCTVAGFRSAGQKL